MSKKTRIALRSKTYLFLFSIICTIFSQLTFASTGQEGIQTYQKNVHASWEHKQKLAADITRLRRADNIWDVLREEFTLPHYEDNPLVQEKIEWFMNNQDFLLRSANRAGPYLYYILQQIKKRHLPAELVLLPIIESGYNPFSRSPVGAMGVWQLMPGTASGLGIKQDSWYDGRKDVIASTRAALNYLAYLQSFFDGNWLLAIAAYNTGEGNVLSAIKRNIRDGQGTDFWSLPVAQATKDYVPSLLALAVIITHPDQYPVYFPPIHNAPYLAQVDLGTSISLKYAASLAGINYNKMIQLNPGYSQPTLSTQGPRKLVVPIENVAQFTENFAASPLNQHQINWTHYRVKSGDTLVLVAKKFNTTTVALRKLNHLNAKTALRHGTNLLIPNRDKAVAEADTTSTEPLSKKSKLIAQLQKQRDKFGNIKPNKAYALQAGDTVYMVRSKDTLESIAKRFHIDGNLLLTTNQLTKKQLKPGKQLIIPTHVAENTTTVSTKRKKLSPGDTIYMVRRGDTIEKIASRFKTSAAAIRVTNLVSNDSLQEGDRLVVPTHLKG